MGLLVTNSVRLFGSLCDLWDSVMSLSFTTETPRTTEFAQRNYQPFFKEKEYSKLSFRYLAAQWSERWCSCLGRAQPGLDSALGL